MMMMMRSHTYFSAGNQSSHLRVAKLMHCMNKSGFPRVLKSTEIWVWIFSGPENLKLDRGAEKVLKKVLDLASVFLKNQVSDRVIFAV